MKPRSSSSSQTAAHSQTANDSQTTAHAVGDQSVAQRRRGLVRLGLAWLAMMQVMMFALPGYLRPEAGGQDSLEVLDWAILLMNWASLTLTIPVILYSAWPIWLGCARAWSARRISMDVPVGISLLAAFIPSVVATFKGSGEVYFDSITMFVAFLLTARYVEQRASLVDSVACTQNVPARVERPLSGVAPEQTSLAGLSAPLSAGALIQTSVPAAGVPSGLRVSAPANMASFSLPLMAQANRVATLFVLIQLTVAAVIAAVWWLIAPTQAWSVLVSLLVMSCPCALSLAAPVSLAALQVNLALDEPLPANQQEALLECTVRITRQNLFGALAWHVLTMPLAAMGWVTPWLAALSMLLSSVAVLLNAWRLFQPRRAGLSRAVGVLTQNQHLRA
jgi:cation transport ATPase